MKKLIDIRVLLALLLIPLALSACNKDFLDRQPEGAFTEAIIKNSTDGPDVIIEGLHSLMYTYGFGQFHGNGLHAQNIQLDMLSDLYINSRPAYYMGIYRWTVHRDPYGSLNYNVWRSHYVMIHNVNQALSAASEDGFSSKGKYHEMMAEAHLFRAYSMSYLVQCFGPRYKPGGGNTALGVVNRTEPTLEPKPRATVEENYTQIKADIEASLKHYVAAAEAKALRWEKNRLNLPTAYGIIARIYLGMSDYANAAKYAQLSIETAEKSGHAALATGGELLDGFNNWNNIEWMWAYKQASDQNMFFAGFGVPYSYNFSKANQQPTYAINRSYYDKMGDNDIRRQWFVARQEINGELEPIMDMWKKLPEVASPTLFKKVRGTGEPDWEYTGQQVKLRTIGGSESSFMDALFMRLGEMYYILAESQARQGNLQAATATLEKVMKTRDPNYTVDPKLDAEGLAFEVLRNKWIDLYYEGGVFFDQKRIGHYPQRLTSGNDKYMTPVDVKLFVKRNSGDNANAIATSADDIKWVFAIPYNEIVGSNGLVEQNEL